MAFVLHPPSKRRVKVGLETGMEYEERTNPLDESYLELLAEDGDKQRGEEEVGPRETSFRFPRKLSKCAQTCAHTHSPGHTYTHT